MISLHTFAGAWAVRVFEEWEKVFDLSCEVVEVPVRVIIFLLMLLYRFVDDVFRLVHEGRGFWYRACEGAGRWRGFPSVLYQSLCVRGDHIDFLFDRVKYLLRGALDECGVCCCVGFVGDVASLRFASQPG